MNQMIFKQTLRVAGLSVALALFSSYADAQAPAAGTASSGVVCKDGTVSTKTGRGACRGHKGVDKTKSAAATTAASAAPAASAATAAPAAPVARKAAPAPVAAAVGGGAGQVWVNNSSKVYHCQGDQWYGKTKNGQYMTQAAAKAAGDRPARGKACS